MRPCMRATRNGCSSSSSCSTSPRGTSQPRTCAHCGRWCQPQDDSCLCKRSGMHGNQCTCSYQSKIQWTWYPPCAVRRSRCAAATRSRAQARHRCTSQCCKSGCCSQKRRNRRTPHQSGSCRNRRGRCRFSRRRQPKRHGAHPQRQAARCREPRHGADPFRQAC